MKELLKMERYHLFHNFIYWFGICGVFLMGIVTADSYVTEVMGPSGGVATSLEDIFNGMVYDSTFLLVIISSLLALILGGEFSERTIDQEICAGHLRKEIFVSKLVVYLVGFNLMTILYPIAGCVREFAEYKVDSFMIFSVDVVKAIVYSFFLNSVIFLIAFLLCILIQNKAKAVTGTALIIFVLALYLGYGMKFNLPIAFLPTHQIREVVSHTEIFLPFALVTGIIWAVILIGISWIKFSKCDLK